MKPFLQRYPFLTHPWWSLIICIGLVVPIWNAGRDIKIQSQTQTLMEGDQRNLQTYEKVDDILERKTIVVISMEDPQLFSQGGFQRLRSICEQLETVDGLVDVKSLTHSYKPIRKGFQFDMVPFIPEGELSDEEISKIQSYSLSHPLVKNIMVGEDGKHTIITATFERDLRTPSAKLQLQSEVDEAIASHRSENVRFKVVALPFIEEEIKSAISSDLKLLLPVLFLLVAATVWFALRSLKGMAVAAINVLFSVSLIPGGIKLLGLELSFYALMLIPLIGGLQLTLTLHLLTRYLSNQKDNQIQSLADAVQRVIKSSTFATLTTMIGLGSLILCQVDTVSDFGKMGSLAVLIIFLWTFGPGLAVTRILFGNKPLRTDPQHAIVHHQRIEAYVAKLSVHRTKILWASFAILIVAGIGLRQIRTDIRIVEFLDPESNTRQALTEFDQVYGGINIVQLEFDTGKDGGVNNIDFLKYMEDVQDYAGRIPEVSGTYSFAQLIAMMNQIWEMEKPGSLRIPDNRLTLGLFLVALKATDYPFLRALSDTEGREAYLIVRTRDMPSEKYLSIIESIEEHARAELPEGVSVSAAKGLHTILEADRKIMNAQNESVALTLGAVGVVLALLWLSVPLSSVSIFANAIPVAAVMSSAGFLQIPLNSVTVMVAAIVLGIAIDDTVHLITWWKDERAKGASAKEAMVSALSAKFRPILCTSLVLVVVLGSFQIFSFPPLRHFGVLSSAAFAGALFSVLVLVPAYLLGKEEPQSQSEPSH